MPDYPIRILECVNKMDRAGLETMLMNYYRHIDRSKVQFDFLTHRPDQGEYDDEIESLGGKIYHAPRLYPQNYIKYFQWMKRFFTTHHYPVVHSHIDAMSVFPLAAAKRAGVPVRIAHSHSESIDKNFKYIPKQIFRKILPHYANHLWACSKQAGIFLYGTENANRIKIIPNAIDLQKYSFDLKTRENERKILGLPDNEVAIGHVGRLTAVKNHRWLIEMAKELNFDHVPFKMFFVGEGELRSKLEQEVADHGLENIIRFLGLRTDVADLMQAFDVLVFPSLYEGIPLTLIEAQASGLPVVASDRVSNEALIEQNTMQISLKTTPDKWAHTIVQISKGGRARDPLPLLKKAGYDIHQSAKLLQKTYLELYSDAKKLGR